MSEAFSARGTSPQPPSRGESVAAIARRHGPAVDGEESALVGLRRRQVAKAASAFLENSDVNRLQQLLQTTRFKCVVSDRLCCW